MKEYWRQLHYMGLKKKWSMGVAENKKLNITDEMTEE